MNKRASDCVPPDTVPKKLKTSESPNAPKESSQECFQPPPDPFESLCTTEADPTDSEASQCMICLESWTMNGVHRLVSLKCGHLFGKSCIEKWLKNSGTCPSCKSPGRVADLRVLYAVKIIALDIAEKEKVDKELAKERLERAKLAREKEDLWVQHQRLKRLYDDLSRECRTINQKMEQLLEMNRKANLQNKVEPLIIPSAAPLSTVAILPPLTPPTSLSAPSTSTTNIPSSTQTCTAPLHVPPARSRFNLEQIAHINITDGRVIHFCPLLSLLLASTKCGAKYALRKINVFDINSASTIPLHTGMIKDIKSSPHREDKRVLTASADKTLKVTNLETDNLLLSYSLSSPVWSCEWHPTSNNVIFAGTLDGFVYIFDLRNTKACLRKIRIDRQPIHSLCYIKNMDDKENKHVTKTASSAVDPKGKLEGILASCMGKTCLWVPNIPDAQVQDSAEEASLERIQPSVESNDPPEKINIVLPAKCTHVQWDTRTNTGLATFRQTPTHPKTSYISFQLTRPSETHEITPKIESTINGNSVSKVLSRSLLCTVSDQLLVFTYNEDLKKVELWDRKTSELITSFAGEATSQASTKAISTSRLTPTTPPTKLITLGISRPLQLTPRSSSIGDNPNANTTSETPWDMVHYRLRNRDFVGILKPGALLIYSINFVK